jgi:hypothetical protein
MWTFWEGDSKSFGIRNWEIVMAVLAFGFLVFLGFDFFFFFGSTGVRTQGLMLAKQVLLMLATLLQPQFWPLGAEH